MNFITTDKHSAVETLLAAIQKIDGAYASLKIRAYKADFTQFIKYCEIRGDTALPAHPITVASYIQHLTSKAYSSSYIRRVVAAISTIH